MRRTTSGSKKLISADRETGKPNWPLSLRMLCTEPTTALPNVVWNKTRCAIRYIRLIIIMFYFMSVACNADSHLVNKLSNKSWFIVSGVCVCVCVCVCVRAVSLHEFRLVFCRSHNCCPGELCVDECQHAECQHAQLGEHRLLVLQTRVSIGLRKPIWAP